MAEPHIAGISSHIRKTKEYARRIAATSAPVLITGETGTGKDLLARYLHYHSNRRNLHVVNCAAVAPELFESEFFGHTRSAFTGASHSRRGHFSVADGGTLVLDEIAEIGMRFQVKLLRAIENNEIIPLGSERIIRIDTRIVALTNRDLGEEIKCSRFRSDLFHRLNAFHIRLRPLRERCEDIPEVLQHLQGRMLSDGLITSPIRLSRKEVRRLTRQKLHGNVRDLANLLTKLSVLGGSARADRIETLLAGQKDATGSGAAETASLQQYLRAVEQRKITETLQAYGHNITHAARALGLSRQGLQYRLRRLKID